jgi:hypothetical protein
VRADDSQLVLAHKHTFASERRKLVEWAADEAALLRLAYERGLDELAEGIMYTLYVASPKPSPLRLVAPTSELLRKRVASLQPTFEWEAFPGPDDREWIGDGSVENITYELRITRAGETRHPVALEHRGVSGLAYTPETPLEPNTAYDWSVRARYEFQGEKRVTPWSASGKFRTPREQVRYRQDH